MKCSTKHSVFWGKGLAFNGVREKSKAAGCVAKFMLETIIE